MAKLKAPLLSLGASGAIGKTLVFFNWKGLDVVREYVIPSNPKTDAQLLQRSYLKAAVAAIHAYQAHVAAPPLPADYSAYALLGSLAPTPRTWFNAIVKQWLDQMIDELERTLWGHGFNVATNETLTVYLDHHGWTAGAITACKVHYGTSKSALVNTEDTNPTDLHAGQAIAGLKNGVKYYYQIRPTTPDTYLGANSGIYSGVPKA